jgi:alkylhydroperoxidase/carboxymuconolactone decarboxylase family protein YurZ
VSYIAKGVDLAALRAEAEELLAQAPPGQPLSPLDRALVEYAVCACVTILDLAGARRHAEAALDLGATPAQLHEVLALASGLGMHTLMEGSRDLADIVVRRGGDLPSVDEPRRELRERLLGTGTYWEVFEDHVPGFLDALLRLSPEAFEGFIGYGSIPARTRQLPMVLKEIISVAVDALPNHRYLPGLRFHLANALKLGAGRADVLEAIDLAAAVPAPPGVS